MHESIALARAHLDRAAWGRAQVVAIGLPAIGSTPAAAQTVTATTGAINGTVTDATSAYLAGTTVRLSGTSLMASATTLTDAVGTYRFSAVPPGDYTLTFEFAGFGTVRSAGIRVGLGFTATVDVELQPDTVSAVVVVGASPIVDIASSALTTPFDAEKLASLPGARDIFSLMSLTPAVAMSRIEWPHVTPLGGNGDVAGNLALPLPEYTAYGLRATTGVNRNKVEGIRVGGANGSKDNDFSTPGHKLFGYVQQQLSTNDNLNFSVSAVQAIVASDAVAKNDFPVTVWKAEYDSALSSANGQWDPGEEGRLISVSRGSVSTRLDAEIENTFVHQATAYIEREVAPGFGLRTGVVVNARRQPYGTIDVSRSLEAYSVPVVVHDPGPDGRLGSPVW